jgi:hypothetical protein
MLILNTSVHSFVQETNVLLVSPAVIAQQMLNTFVSDKFLVQC